MRSLCFILFLSVMGIHQVFSQDVISPADYNHPVRVAVIGASTTYGANIANRLLNSFPAQLGRLLGPGWLVRNFGVNSTGILKKGDHPYWETDDFIVAQRFLPDVVIFNLGVNDVKPQNWKYKADFYRDYKEMIHIFQRLSSHPRIYICREIPVFHDRWGIRAAVVNKELYPMKKKLAREEKLPMIDLYSPLANYPEVFTDGIHPDKRGAGMMAIAVARALTGKMIQQSAMDSASK